MSRLNTVHRGVEPPHHVHVYYLIGACCVWASLGCIVLEEGGDSIEPDRSLSPPPSSSGGDEFEEFEELDPGESPEAPKPPEVPVTRDVVVKGRLTGGPEQGGELVVLWYVTTGETPYFYKYGEGALSPAGAWTVSVPGGAPPDEALNVDGVGVALVMGLKQWTGTMAEGRLSRTDFRAMEQAAFGLSKDHALVYIRDGAVPLTTRTWAADFEQGALVCGVRDASQSRGVEAQGCEAFTLVVTRELGWLMF